jgi:hypothetical protein
MGETRPLLVQERSFPSSGSKGPRIVIKELRLMFRSTTKEIVGTTKEQTSMGALKLST